MNKSTPNSLEDAIRRLRESDATRHAPDLLESQLLQAFRGHHAARKRRHRVWIPSAIAASLLFAVASQIDLTVVETPTIHVSSIRPPQPLLDPAPVNVRSDKPKRRARRPVAPPPRPLSVASSGPVPSEREFVHIPYAPPFTTSDAGHVVRVNMAGSSARRMGIPVLTDRVQADLVLGNDGLPRAIRVVSNSTSSTDW